MDHAPIYRAEESRPPSASVPVRRSASLVTAVAVLTIGGIALGYHGFAQPGLDMPPAPDQAASITVPVPIVSLPLINGGHPDLLAQISSALAAPVAEVRAIVQPAPPPPTPVVVQDVQPDTTSSVFLPEPLPPAFVLSVDIGAPDDQAPPPDAAATDASAAPDPASPPVAPLVA
ncbi:MAG TPA: hypothetical protein VGK33_14365, partial [Chloroflexota bacterium]